MTNAIGDINVDPRWVLDAYAPDLRALIQLAPDLHALVELSEGMITAIQEEMRDRYKELATTEMVRGLSSY